MKTAFTLLVLSTAAFASNIEKRWYNTTTTQIVRTTTTVCPATTTRYSGGHTSIITYLETSTIIISEAPVETTVYLPDTTQHFETTVYTTYETPCPVTGTKTVAGKPVEVTYTTISTIIKAIPTTILEYTTSSTTCYETTEVYQTESVSVTYYTTVSASSTVAITASITSTIDVTLFYTVTSTFELPTTKATVFIPVTEISSKEVTAVTTIPSERTKTEQGTVISIVSYTVVETSVAPAPTTTMSPLTSVSSVAVLSTVTVAQKTTSSSAAPAQFTGNSATENRAGGVAAAAGAGVLLFLALA